MAGKTQGEVHEGSPKKSPRDQDKAFAKQDEGLMGIKKPGAKKETVQERQSRKAKSR